MADYKGIKIKTRKVPSIGWQYQIEGQVWSHNTFHSESDAVSKAKDVLKKSGI